MAATKKYTEQAQIGEAGVALIDQVVTAMGFIWHARRVDHGIDGEIELVDVVRRTPLNRVVFVQSKASSQPFPGENEEGFHYNASVEDVDYWRRANVPVIIVCSHPATGEAWWALSSRAQSAGNRRTCRISFDKRADRFDQQCAPALLNIEADQPRPNTGIVASARTERLVSNLLRVETFADTIWMSPTWLRRPNEANAILRSAGVFCSDWILADGTLFSFTHPEHSPLELLVEGPPEALETSEWSASKDVDLQRRFVRLLNQVLIDSRSETLRRHPDGSLFVRPSRDLSPVKMKVGASGSGRTVFERYTDRDDQQKVRHYRHYALKANFVRRDGQWFAELEPTYHYTFDGYREVPWANELRKGIKKLEKNEAVRRLVEFWAAYLAPRPSLFSSEDDRLVFGDLMAFEVDRGIHDPSWKPAIEPSDVDQPDAEGSTLW